MRYYVVYFYSCFFIARFVVLLNIIGREFMNKRDIAGYLGIDRTTLYNWEKYKPNLYKTVMLGLMVDEVIHKAQKNVDELLLMKSSLDKRNENSTDNTK